MSSSGSIDGLAEKEETRVMGLGVGVFLIFFFSLVSAVVCLVGATTPRPGAFACGGAGLLGFVFFILLVAEKDSRYVEDKSDQLQQPPISPPSDIPPSPPPLPSAEPEPLEDDQIESEENSLKAREE